MTKRAESVRVAYPLFQAGGGGSTPTSALQLTLDTIPLQLAIRLNRLWHSRLPRLDQRVASWLCYGAEFGGLWYAVGVWSLPISRELPQDGTWLELRRLAVAPDAPRNTPSRVIAVMARLIRRERPETVRLISYQDMEVHTGAIYRAAGWTATTTRTGGCWSQSRRGDTAAGRRPKGQSNAPKQRWEKAIR